MTRRTVRAGLALLAVSTLLPGCIQRYKAPDGPADTSTPYSALAVYLEINPPVGESESGLPLGALRVASDGESVFADAALVQGPEHAGITETWAGALALLQVHGESEVVVLANESGLDAVCRELPSMAHRMTRAVRATDAPLTPLKATKASDGQSRDPLRGVPLSCP